MECPYCKKGRSFIPGANMCADCRDQFESNEVEIGAKYILQGHTTECSNQMIKTGACVCGL